jgi:phage protein D
MAEIVNLKSARKQAVRAKKRVQADANAAKFGRTKTERTREEAEAEQARQRLDAHRLGPGEDG